MAARRRDWNSEESIVDWALDDWTAHDSNRRGVRKRHMVHSGSFDSPSTSCAKDFSDQMDAAPDEPERRWGEQSERIRD
jgi:hypothetical protein